MTPDATLDLARSGISPEEAERAGIYCVEAADEVYPDDFEPLPALVFPYFTPDGAELFTFDRDGEETEFARVRYLAEKELPRGFKKKKMQRYGQPKNSGIHAYFPQGTGVDWPAVIADPRTPILITEGEKKALRSCLAGYPTIGLGGVFNFAQDKRGGLIAPLLEIVWRHRPVFIVFDSDASTNPNILTAEARLSQELSLKHGADVHVVRLPDAASGDKQGIDDILVADGDDAFFKLLDAAPQVRKIDAEVMSLNEDVCWIDRDGLLYELETGLFIQKANFTNGSVYSTRKLVQPAKKGSGTVEVSVAQEWLTHPHAQRYSDIVFNPGTLDRSIAGEHGTCLNIWKGFETMEGDVTPFLKLTEYVFKDMPPEHRDLALKLMIYKLQNPEKKIPLALVMIGMSGSGKSLWSQMIREAAGVYGWEIPSSALVSDYNGYVERALVAVVNEADPKDVSKGGDVLKRRISETTDMLNEKYRVARQVKTYTSYILTANKREVADFGGDDRRMIVVNCPPPHPDGDKFYLPMVEWLHYKDGGKKIANYVLNYDLKGWTPPLRAPMTPEKYMAFIENLTPVQRLAVEMQTADENTIAMWVSSSLAWAQSASMSNDAGIVRKSKEISESLSRITIRPFYTPEELAMLFPALGASLHGRKGHELTAGEISKELRNAGVPYLTCSDDPRGFKLKGRMRQFLVVSSPEEYVEPMSQKEFDTLWPQWPTYSDYAEWRAKGGLQV